MVPQKPDFSERWRRERLHVVDGQLIKKASPRLQGVGPCGAARQAPQGPPAKEIFNQRERNEGIAQRCHGHVLV